MKLWLREDGVDDLGDDGVFVADDAGEERSSLSLESRSLAMRFSRSSSLTLRARRAGVNSLAAEGAEGRRERGCHV